MLVYTPFALCFVTLRGIFIVTTQDFIKFWGKFFCAFVLLEMIEISQGFKTFESI
jgi:hypothetical protein